MTQNADKKREQVQFLCMDDMVPQNHLLRIIDKAIDWNFIYDLVIEKYSQNNGRPSMDPVMLIKIPFIQYLYGIGSMWIYRSKRVHFLNGISKIYLKGLKRNVFTKQKVITPTNFSFLDKIVEWSKLLKMHSGYDMWKKVTDEEKHIVLSKLDYPDDSMIN